MPESIPRRLDALTETAHELASAINELNQDTGQRVVGVNRRLHRNQKVMWIVIASFIVDILVTSLMLWTFHVARDAATEAKQATERLNYSAQVQRRKVLCPLYQLFEESKSPQARKTNPNGPEAYDRAFKIIDEGYKALNCGAPLPKQPITPVTPNKK